MEPETPMAEIHHINPPGRTPPVGYTHATAARGQRIIHVSGQVAYDADGKIVGQGDLKRQTETACENLSSALAAAGAGLSDVVKTTIYVVDYKPSDLAVIREVRFRFFGRENLPANTLVGVQSLAAEGLMIEIEAVAVAD